jgi:hypothetical protein
MKLKDVGTHKYAEVHKPLSVIGDHRKFEEYNLAGYSKNTPSKFYLCV